MRLHRRVLLSIAFYLVRVIHWLRRLLGIAKKQLSHHERVSRVYHFLHYAAVKSGAYSKYTEGHYDGHESESKSQTIYDYYASAQDNQLNCLLDLARLKANGNGNRNGTKKRLRLLDAGCGNGDLSFKAKRERDADTVGLTMSEDEVRENRRRGLHAIKHSFTQLSDSNHFARGEFDAVISNGSSEHLISIEQACKDKGKSVIERQLREYWHVLKPGGFLCFTCIHFREDIDPRRVQRDAWHYPLESRDWHFSVLCGFYSGWYPHGDVFAEIATARVGFELVSKKETTNDYLQTSLVWRRKILDAMATRKGLYWCCYIWLFELFCDPVFAWYSLAYYFGASWTWQFQNQDGSRHEATSPCVHYTITFKKPLN